MDGHTKQCLGGIADYSITGLYVAEQLDVLALNGAVPGVFWMNTGSELISSALANGASETDTILSARRILAKRMCRVVQRQAPRRMS